MRVSDQGSEHGALADELFTGIVALGETGALMIADFGADGVVIWDVRRDGTGTAQGRHWSAIPWASLLENGQLSETEMDRVARAETGTRVIFVCSAPTSPYAAMALDWLRIASPRVPVFQHRAPLDGLLRRVLADIPLTQWYELVTLRQARSGRLSFTGCPLFPPGARRGDCQPLVIRCEAADANGVVFAVVATESTDRFRLVSVASVNLPPGRYDLSAELRRPGLVHFRGLPGMLRPDHRRWSDLVATVPDRIDFTLPTHLLCAVEISGQPEQVRERISRARQLIELAADKLEDRLSVSLIAYGPHSLYRDVPDEPAMVLTWAERSPAALDALDWQYDRGPVGIGYPRAAQLECVLATVAERLSSQEGRPVLVTIGSRPPFPPRVDPVSEIIPCPLRRDWRKALWQLREIPGLSFGAVRDDGADHEIWTSLGSEAFSQTEVVDWQGFLADLGMVKSSVPLLSFPLIDPEGS
jgi:hypothetical protein